MSVLLNGICEMTINVQIFIKGEGISAYKQRLFVSLCACACVLVCECACARARVCACVSRSTSQRLAVRHHAVVGVFFWVPSLRYSPVYARGPPRTARPPHGDPRWIPAVVSLPFSEAGSPPPLGSDAMIRARMQPGSSKIMRTSPRLGAPGAPGAHPDPGPPVRPCRATTSPLAPRLHHITSRHAGGGKEGESNPQKPSIHWTGCSEEEEGGGE